ncbi:cholecystokinin receptor type A-like [Mercenaria mercenaria]|uniref:cholecystokinin receptor type A-like n=1 Tax=Mercenaria mercenaria TaxID=6596 RepID=UPI001E1DBAF3|nr:cholecystokinin receptor type A-like [Mercenaria mercenaria]
MMENKMNITLAQLNKLELTKYLPVTIILVIIMCVGIVGNFLVLFIYKRKFKRSSARVYILSLALADLTVCIFGIPYHVLDLTLILNYTDIYLCKVFSYFIGACTFSSIFILIVVGLDRYLKVCRPLKRQIVDFGDRKACIIAVFVAIVISVPNGIIYGHSSVHTGVNNLTGVECFIADEFQGSGLAFGYLGFTMLVFLVCVVMLIIMYAFICHTIYKNDSSTGEITLQNRRKMCLCCSIDSHDVEEEVGAEQVELQKINTSAEEPDRKHYKKKNEHRNKDKFRHRETMIRHSQRKGTKIEEKNTRKITLMMMTITIVFIIAYLPFIIISTMDNLDETFWDDLAESKALIYDLLLRIYLINNAANPIIYSFWDARFRTETVRLFRKILFCWNEFKVETKSNSKSSSSSTSTKLTEGTLK